MLPSIISTIIISLLAQTDKVRSLSTTSVQEQDVAARSLPELWHYDLIKLAFHSSTKAGNNIYIDGGEMNIFDAQKNPSNTYTLNDTLTLDLSTSWDVDKVPFRSIRKPAGVPLLNYGALWTTPDDKSIISFGGIRSPYPSAPRLTSVEIWQYSESTSWIDLPSLGWLSPSLTGVRPALAANTFGGNMGYMLGGIKGNDHAPYSPLPGMLTYNMINNTWTNESTSAVSPFGLVGGSLTFVRGFGQQGVLIAMGGEYTHSGAWMESATNFVPFTNISIWDIATKTWFWQAATANFDNVDIPNPVTLFCTTGVASSNGTFEIFLYGGHDNTFVLSSKAPSVADQEAQQKLNGVYVLSLPSFTWTKVNDEGAEPRTGHSCNLIGNRQMLSIGGLNPSLSLNTAQSTPDPWKQSLQIFDMVDLKWNDNYDASAAPYSTPDIVKKWYDSHNTSDIDWSSDTVRELFFVKMAAPNGTNEVPPSSNGNKAINWIIPAVVAIVLFVCGLIGCSVCASRHHFKKKKELANQETCSDCREHQESTASNRHSQARNSFFAQGTGFILDTIRGVHSPETMLTPRRVVPEATQDYFSMIRPVETPKTEDIALRELVSIRTSGTSSGRRSPVSPYSPVHTSDRLVRFSTASRQSIIVTPLESTFDQPVGLHRESKAELVNEPDSPQPWERRGSQIQRFASEAETAESWHLQTSLGRGIPAGTEAGIEAETESVRSWAPRSSSLINLTSQDGVEQAWGPRSSSMASISEEQLRKVASNDSISSNASVVTVIQKTK